MQNVKRKTLREKYRSVAPFRSVDTPKRAVCGTASINDNEVLLITLVVPGKQDTMWILDKSMCTDEELVDTLGDKVNELKNDGYEIDYRFDKPINVNINQ
jgi:hypothetical protein